MTSKIIQISSNGAGNSENLYALCEDGSVWVLINTASDYGWKQVEKPFHR